MPRPLVLVLGIALLAAAPPPAQDKELPDAARIVADLERAVRHVRTGTVDFRGRSYWIQYSGTVSFERGRFIHLLIAFSTMSGGWSCDEYVLTPEWIHSRRGRMNSRGVFAYEAWKAPVTQPIPAPWGRNDAYLEFLVMARAAPELTFRFLGPLSVFPANTSEPDEIMLIRKRWPNEPRTPGYPTFRRFAVFVNLKETRISATGKTSSNLNPTRVADAPETGGISFPKELRYESRGLISPLLRYTARRNALEPTVPSWASDPALPVRSEEQPPTVLDTVAALLGVKSTSPVDQWIKAVREKLPSSMIAWESVWARVMKNPTPEHVAAVREAEKEAGVTSRLGSFISLSLAVKQGSWKHAAEILKSELRSKTVEAIARPSAVRVRAHLDDPGKFADWLNSQVNATSLENRLDWAWALQQSIETPRPFARAEEFEVPPSLRGHDLPPTRIPSVLHLALARQDLRVGNSKGAFEHFKAFSGKAEWLPLVLEKAVKPVEDVETDVEFCDLLVEAGATSLKLAKRYLDRKAKEGKTAEAAETLERLVRNLKTIPPRFRVSSTEHRPGEGAAEFVESLESNRLHDLARLTVRNVMRLPWASSGGQLRRLLQDRFDEDLTGAIELARLHPRGFRSGLNLLGQNYQDALGLMLARAKRRELSAETLKLLHDSRGQAQSGNWEDLIEALAKRFPDHSRGREMRGDLRMKDAEFDDALDEYAHAAERVAIKPPYRKRAGGSHVRVPGLPPVKSEAVAPEFHPYQPLWIKLALAARRAGRSDEGVELLIKYARPSRRDFAYQVVGRAYEILGKKKQARRHYWLSLLSGESHSANSIWTYSFAVDELARQSRDSKQWRDLLLAAKIARQSLVRPPVRFGGRVGALYSSEAMTNRFKEYEQEAIKRISFDELVQELLEVYSEKPISPEIRKTVSASLRDLASDSAVSRDAATETLGRLGPSISPLLVPGLESSDLEKSRRIRTMLRPWAVDALIERRLNELPWP